MQCALCCYHTEMLLAKKDIERIEQKLHLAKEEFCFQKDNFFQLRNVNQHCFFLDPISKKCRIYEIRPSGCVFYPLIFDENTQRCIYDSDCPISEQFYATPTEYKDNCAKLKRWIRTELLF